MPETTNPYESPRQPSKLPSSPSSSPSDTWSRIVRPTAAAIAIGNTAWWVWVAISLPRFSDWEIWLAMHAPAYAVTCGHYWRAIGRPAVKWCRLVWGCSFVIQAALLLWMAYLLLEVRGDGIVVLLTLWFEASAFMSLIGLFLDSGGQPADSHRPWRV